MTMLSTENVDTIFMGTMFVGILGSLIQFKVLPLLVVLISCICLYLYRKYYTHHLPVATESSLELEKTSYKVPETIAEDSMQRSVVNRKEKISARNNLFRHIYKKSGQ